MVVVYDRPMRRLFLILFAIACTKPAPPPQQQAAAKPAPPELNGTEWQLNAMRGKPIPQGTRVTLSFTGGEAGGYGGCNWYGGPFTRSGSTIQFKEMTATQRGCGSPRGSQETEYLRLLHNSPFEYQIDGDRLTLREASGATALEFTRIPALAMNPADLAGTRWQLAKSPVTLELGRDTMRGFGGCRDFTGTYSAKGDKIRFTSLAMTQMECGKGLEAQRAEENFTTDLSETERYRLTGTSLELTTSPGRVLTFMRAADVPVAQGGTRLLPVDEASKDASFATFRDSLITAVERHDKDALLAAIADDIKTDFGGGGGRAGFVKHWKLDGDGQASPLWSELSRILKLGGAFREQTFWAPYVYSSWPESVDSFEYVAAVGPRVAVRDDKSRVIATLDHHVVKIAQSDPVRHGDRSSARRKIVMPDGHEGWVAREDVRSPIDYRAGFDKKNGAWKMTILVAGD